MLGKTATALIMVSLALLMLTGATGRSCCMWSGMALLAAAGLRYYLAAPQGGLE